MEQSPEQGSALIADWLRRVRENQYVHYETGAFFSRLNYYLGIPSIILSAAVGTAVFESLNGEGISPNVKIVLGCISILAAVLTSLQTFLRFSERASEHRASGAGFGATRRLLECLKTYPPTDVPEMKRALDEVRAQMDKLAFESPEVPSRLKKKFDGQVTERLAKATQPRSGS